MASAPSMVSGHKTSTAKKVFLVVAILLVIAALYGLSVLSPRSAPDRSAKAAAVGNAGDTGGDFHRASYTPAAVPTPSPASSGITSVLPGAAPSQRVVPVGAFQAQVSSPAVAQRAMAGYGAPPAAEPLAQRVAQASDPGTSVARVLPDRNLYITKGTPIGSCTTESPIRTDVPGQIRCKLANPVYSASGRVRLLDAGTYAVVETSEPLQRGMARAFGVVTRLETPQGCIVDLKSPIADQIGTAGIDGEIYTHFWERIKGPVVIAMLDFVTQTAALAASSALSNATTSGNAVSFNQFGAIGSHAGRGFEDDQNIPSTLSTPQARQLTIQAMTDIDMRGCYSLRATGGRG